jgi:hypothetical protein
VSLTDLGQILAQNRSLPQPGPRLERFDAPDLHLPR